MAIGLLGSYSANECQEGDRAFLGFLAAEEDNLRTAWVFARASGIWDTVIRAMRGLATLYEATDRNGARRRLVEAVAPDFVDPASGGPIPSR